MKLKNIKSFKYTIPVELNISGNKKVVIELSPLPFDFHILLNKWLPTPKPPLRGIAKDPNGRVLKDEKGQLMPQYDTEDVAYKQEAAEVDFLQNVAAIHASLPEDTEFESTLKGDNYREFYSNIAKELKQFGFTSSHFLSIVKALQDDSGLEAIESEKKN